LVHAATQSTPHLRRKISKIKPGIIAALVLTLAPAMAQAPLLPNPALTSGAIADDTTDVICERG
jgi:hypothetical protein